MAAGLTTASAALFFSSSLLLQRQLDQALAGAEGLVAAQVGAESSPGVAVPVGAVDSLQFERDVNRYVALRDAGGGIVKAIPSFANDLPLDSAAFRSAREGHPAWVTATWRGRSVRNFYARVPRLSERAEQVLQVAALLGPIEAAQRELLLVLVAVVLVGSGATFLGAWWLARWAVGPVAEITAQATQIEPGTLNHRIVAHADTVEYRGLVAVLNGMIERLDAAFQSQRRLTGDVSHELRSPLTALRGEIEVALRAERSAREYQLVLRSALEEIERLTTMSEDLLLITRAESNLLPLDRVPTDPNAIVRDALQQLHKQIEEKGLEIEESLDPAVRSVSLDPGLVTRLVEHLMDNAVKFAPFGGRIRVETDGGTPAMNGVRVAIENSGAGIAPEDLPHVFEPFYRADQARSRGTGTGLGLSLVAAIARLHGGAVRARNQDGAGVRFEVDLPAVASG